MNKKATSTTKPTVKVIGIGCGGNNIVNHLCQSDFESMSFVACDMDAKVLEKSVAATTLQLGTDCLGSGNKSEKANFAAEENVDAIKKLFTDKPSLTFVITCLGGGCGTGAAPVIACESKRWASRPLPSPLCLSSWKANADSRKHWKESKTWPGKRMPYSCSTTNTSKNDTATNP